MNLEKTQKTIYGMVSTSSQTHTMPEVNKKRTRTPMTLMSHSKQPVSGVFPDDMTTCLFQILSNTKSQNLLMHAGLAEFKPFHMGLSNGLQKWVGNMLFC